MNEYERARVKWQKIQIYIAIIQLVATLFAPMVLLLINGKL